MVQKSEFPCQLTVLLAKEAPVGLIFRRGPSKWTQLIKWNTDVDTFEPGAWFKGRIFPGASDLSPDGSKLVYHAVNHANFKSPHPFPCSWTAISKVPWMTALAAWDDYAGGGGRFLSNSEMNMGRLDESNALKDFKPQGLQFVVDHRAYSRLPWGLFHFESDGWKVVAAPSVLPNGQSDPQGVYVFEKASDRARLVLKMTSVCSPGYDIGRHSFEVKTRNRDIVIPLSDVNWANWDQQGRLVYSREGKLLTAKISGSGELLPKELADFISSRPEKTKSPDWARHW